jgi:hypothetical protein
MDNDEHAQRIAALRAAVDLLEQRPDMPIGDVDIHFHQHTEDGPFEQQRARLAALANRYDGVRHGGGNSLWVTVRLCADPVVSYTMFASRKSDTGWGE